MSDQRVDNVTEVRLPAKFFRRSVGIAFDVGKYLHILLKFFGSPCRLQGDTKKSCEYVHQILTDFYQRDRIASYAIAGIDTTEISVCSSVCPSHSGIVSKWTKQRYDFFNDGEPEDTVFAEIEFGAF